MTNQTAEMKNNRMLQTFSGRKCISAGWNIKLMTCCNGNKLRLSPKPAALPVAKWQLLYPGRQQDV
jgi:hypothetical protein